MVKFVFALICVLLLQLSKASCQTNWKLIMIDSDSTKVYVNSNKIVKRINSAVVWVQYICKPDSIHQKQEALAFGNKYVLYDLEVVKQIFDFKDNRIKTLSDYKFLNGGLVKKIQLDEKNANWEDILPESIGDVEFTFFKKHLHMKN